jgi:DNA-binding MarR family transcriptional regulator
MPEQHYRPATYRSRDSVGYLVRRFYTLMLARFEGALAQSDFTLTQWIVLIQVHEGVARTASDVAHDLGHDTGALTRVIDQLERRGFLQRHRSARDRRQVELRLTAAGRGIVRQLLPLVVDQTNAALAPLARDEFLQFRDLLVRLLDHAQTTQAGVPVAASAPARKVTATPARGRGAPRKAGGRA